MSRILLYALSFFGLLNGHAQQINKRTNCALKITDFHTSRCLADLLKNCPPGCRVKQFDISGSFGSRVLLFEKQAGDTLNGSNDWRNFLGKVNAPAYFYITLYFDSCSTAQRTHQYRLNVTTHAP